MHSRLPLFLRVPRTTAVGALTVGLLITGCGVDPFRPDEPAVVQHAGVVDEVPESAHDTVSGAAAALSSRIAETQPAAHEEPSDPDQPQRSPGEEISELAEAMSQAHAEAEEAARIAAEEEAARLAAEEEARRAAEEEAARREAQEAEPEPDDEPAPPAPPATEQPAPGQAVPPAAFTGDLNAYLSELASGYPGDISISLVEIGGQQRTASVGGATPHVTASTYKLFVAYSTLRDVEDGAMSWDDPVTGGRDLAQCFQDMLVVSDNPCPEALGPEIGWSTIYKDAASAGAQRTGQGLGAVQTTTNDLAQFLVRLQTGQLNMSGESHQRMLSALAANIHRQGVPAGSSGQVLNKPGFIGGNLHDAAIVRHPQGTYVLTVMSSGSSWGTIASITRGIESALGYQ